MDTIIKISFSLMLAIIGTFSINAQNSIEGSGNTVTKTVNTQPYSSIDISGSMQVFLEKGGEGNITIAAEDNVMDRIIVESDGETLIISMKNNTSLRNTKKIKITVPFEEISEVTLKGSGNVEGRDILKSNSLALNIHGSGNIQASVEANSLDAQLNGSGDMQLSGNVTDVDVKTSGSGNFEGKELISENAQIYISGSGDTSISAETTLKARVHGSGSVMYSGNPSQDVKIMGSGKVKSL